MAGEELRTGTPPGDPLPALPSAFRAAGQQPHHTSHTEHHLLLHFLTCSADTTHALVNWVNYLFSVKYRKFRGLRLTVSFKPAKIVAHVNTAR